MINKITINQISKFFSAILIICYWGFVDVREFMVLAQILFVASCFLRISLLNKWQFVLNDYVKWAIAWLLFCAISILWSRDIDNSIISFISILQVVIVGILLSSTIEKKQDITWIERVIIISGIVLTFRLFIETPSSMLGKGRLGESIGMHVNTISVNILISELLTVKHFFLNYTCKKSRYMNLVLAFAFIVTIFLTASKKAIILMILGPVLMLLYSRKPVSQKTKLIAGCVCIIAFFIAIINYLPVDFSFATRRFFSAIDSYINGSLDASTMERQYLMKSAFLVFLNHFALGVGLDCNRIFNSLNLYAHCNYLEMLANLGLIGFILYYYSYFFIGYKCILHRKKNEECRLNIIILFSICILDIMQITYYMESFQVFLAQLFCSAIVSDEVVQNGGYNKS